MDLIAVLGLLAHPQHFDLPARYTDLNDYVIAAPDQGDTDTCLFQASTGVMEILLNKSLGNHNPQVRGDTDISELYTISAPSSNRSMSWFQDAFLKFDSGEAFLQKDEPFEGWTDDGDINDYVWDMPDDYYTLPRIKLPKIDSVLLFSMGDGRYSRGVLDQSYVDIVKQALIKYQSPILVVGNDTDYWHVVVITGYDDTIQGSCYELTSTSCHTMGAFYVRDSFGTRLEARSYDWFVRRNNSAAVAKLAN